MTGLSDRIAGLELPVWLTQLVAVSRPLVVTMTVAIPAIGAASVGLVAMFDAPRALGMAAASTAFLQGVPDSAYGLIAALGLGYFGAKTYETVKAPPPPAGRASPESAAEPVPEDDETRKGDHL